MSTREINVRFTIESREYQQRLKDIKDRSSDLNRQFNELTGGTGRLTAEQRQAWGAFERTQRAMGGVDAAAVRLARQQRDLNQSLERGVITQRDYDRAMQRLEQNAASAGQSQRQLRGQIDETNDSSNRLASQGFDKLKSAALGLAAAVGSIALAQFSRDTIGAVDAMAKTAATIGITTDRLQELQYAADQMAAVSPEKLNAGMQRFSRRVHEAAEGTGKLKDIQAEYGVQITDSQGKQRELNLILGDYAEAIKNAETEQEQLSMAADAFGKKGGAALVNMLRQGRDAFNEVADSALVVDASLVQAAERMTGALGKMESDISAAGQSLYLAFADKTGIFDSLAESASQVAAKVNEWATAFAKGQFDQQYNTFLGISGALGAVTTALVAKHAALLAVTAAQAAFNAIAAINPYVAIATAVIAATGALWGMRDVMVDVGGVTGTVGDYIQAVWEEIKSSGSGLWKGLSQGVVLFGETAFDVAMKIINPFDVSFGQIMEVAKNAVNFIINVFVGSAKSIGAVATQIYESYKRVFQGISQLAEGLWKSIVNFDASHIKGAIANNAAAGFADGWQSTIGKVEGYLTEHVDYVGAITESAANKLEDVKVRFADISLNRQFEEAIADEKALNETTNETALSLDKFKASAEAAAGGTAKAGSAAKKAADDVDHLQKALEKQAQGVDSLISKFLPARAAQEQLTESVKKAAAAYALGKLSAEEYQTIIAGVHEEHEKALVSAGEATESMATLWKGAIEQIGSDIQGKLADAFESMFNGSLDSAKDFFKSLGDIFKRSLAQLAASVVQNKIVIPIMASMIPGAAGAAGLFGGGGGGLTGDAGTSVLGGGGGLGGLSGIAKMFGGNSIGQSLSNAAFDFMPFDMVGTKIGDGIMNGLASTSNLAMVGGGMAGSFASNLLFDFDSSAEKMGNMIGSSAGTAIGAAISPLLGPLAPLGPLLGSFLGGSGGGFLGGLFGGSGPKMRAGVQGGQIYMGDNKGMEDEVLQKFQQAADELNASMLNTAKMLGPAALDALQNYNMTGKHGPGTVSQIQDDPEAFLQRAAQGMADVMIDAVVDEVGSSGEFFKGMVEDLRAATEGDIQAFVQGFVQLNQAIQAFDPILRAITGEADVAVDTLARTVSSFGELGISAQDAQAAMGSYYERFFSEEERRLHAIDNLQTQVTAAFDAMGEEVPATKAAFRSLVESLDLASEEGNQLFASLMAVAPMFAELADQNAIAANSFTNANGESILFSENLANLQASMARVSEIEPEVQAVFESLGYDVPETAAELETLRESLEAAASGSDEAATALDGIEHLMADYYDTLENGGKQVLSYAEAHQKMFDAQDEINAGDFIEPYRRASDELYELHAKLFDAIKDGPGAGDVEIDMSWLSADIQAAFDEVGHEIPTTIDGFYELKETLAQTAAAAGEQSSAELDRLNAAMPLLEEYYGLIEDIAVAVEYSLAAISDVTTRLTENSGELASGIRGLLNDVVYEGLDAGPAFAEMIEQYIVGTLLDSISQMIYESVVKQLMDSAVQSATSLATGGAMGGTAIKIGAEEGAIDLASIVDKAKMQINIMGQVLADEGFQEAIGEIGELINTIGNQFTGPSAPSVRSPSAPPPSQDYEYARRDREEADAKRAQEKASREAEKAASDAQKAAEKAAKAIQDATNTLHDFADSLSGTTHLDAFSEASQLFGRLGLEMPATSEALADLIQSGRLTEKQTLALAEATDTLGAVYDGLPDIGSGLRKILNDVVYEGIDAGPAFADMVQEYIIGTLLDSFSTMIHDAVVAPLIESAMNSAMSLATGGITGGKALEISGLKVAEKLDEIVDDTIKTANLLAEVLANEDVQEAFGQVAGAITDVAGAIHQPTPGWQRPVRARPDTSEDDAQKAADEAEQKLSEQRALEVQILRAQGLELEATTLEREYELESMADGKSHLIDLTKQLWEAQDAYERENDLRSIGLDILRAQGKEIEAVQLEREYELETLQNTKPHLVDLTKELYALQDAAKLADFADSLFPKSFEASVADLSGLFYGLALEMPNTAEGLAELMRSADLTDAQILALTGSFDDLNNVFSQLPDPDDLFNELFGRYTMPGEYEHWDSGGFVNEDEMRNAAINATRGGGADFEKLLQATFEDVFGRLAESDEIGYWSDEWASGVYESWDAFTRGIINAASPDDMKGMHDKNYFSDIEASLESLQQFGDGLSSGTDLQALEDTRALFAELGLEMPLTAQALSELILSGELTREQALKLSDATDTLGQAYGALTNATDTLTSLADTLDPASLKQQAASVTQVFDDLGLQFPATGEAFAELVRAGTLTEEQMLSLADSADAIGAVYEAQRAQEAQRRQLEIALLNAQQEGHAALNAERAIALEQMPKELRGLQERVWAAELQAQRAGLEIDLLRAQGHEQEAVNRERAIALRQLPEELRGLQQQVWAAQEAHAALSELINELKRFADAASALADRIGDDILSLSGGRSVDEWRGRYQAARSSVSLDAETFDAGSAQTTLDAAEDYRAALVDQANTYQSLSNELQSAIESLRGQRLSIEVDLLNALGREQEALNVQRAAELESLPEELHAIQQQIWAAEDAARSAIELADTLLSFADAADQVADQIAKDIASLTGENTLDEARSAYQGSMGGLPTTAGAFDEDAAQAALDAAEDYRAALIEEANARKAAQDELESQREDLINRHRSMEVELLKTLGREQEALNLEREHALDAMPEELHAAQQQIWAAEDEALAASEAAEETQALVDTMLEFSKAAGTLSESIEDNIAALTGAELTLEAQKAAYTNALGAVPQTAEAFDEDAAQTALDSAEDYRSALMDQAQTHQDASDQLKNAREGLRDWVDALDRTSDAFSNQRNRAASWEQYQTTLAAAQAGDVDALGDITGIADDYLSATKSTAGSELEYQREVARRRAEIEGLADDETDPNIEALNEVVGELQWLNGTVLDLKALWEVQTEELNDEMIDSLSGELAALELAIIDDAGIADIISELSALESDMETTGELWRVHASQLHEDALTADLANIDALINGIVDPYEAMIDGVIGELTALKDDITSVSAFWAAEAQRLHDDLKENDNSNTEKVVEAITDWELAVQEAFDNIDVLMEIIIASDLPEDLKGLALSGAETLQRTIQFLVDDTELPEDLKFLALGVIETTTATIRFVVENDLPDDLKRIALGTLEDVAVLIDFIVRSDLPDDLKEIALMATESVSKTIQLIVASDMPDDLKEIALLQADTIPRLIQMVIEADISDDLKRLALGHLEDVTVTIGMIADTDALSDDQKRVLFDQTGRYMALIESVDFDAAVEEDLQDLLLKPGDLIDRSIRFLIENDDISDNHWSLITNAQDTLLRTLELAWADGGISPEERAQILDDYAVLERLIRVEYEEIGGDFWSDFLGAAGIMQFNFTHMMDDLSALNEEEYNRLVSYADTAFQTKGIDFDMGSLSREQQELLFGILNDHEAGVSLSGLDDISVDDFTGAYSHLGSEDALADMFERLQGGGKTMEEVLEEGLVGNKPKTAIEYLDAIWKILALPEEEDGREINPINVILTDILHAMQTANALSEVAIAQRAHMTTSLTSASWDVSEAAWMAEMDAKMATVDMPEYAKGGIATSASIFGEAGPEAAVPLPDGRTIPVTLSGQHMPPINLIAPEAGNSEELKAGIAELQRELHQLRTEQQRQHNASYRVQKDQLFIEEKREERGMPPTRQGRDQRATQQPEKDTAE